MVHFPGLRRWLCKQSVCDLFLTKHVICNPYALEHDEEKRLKAHKKYPNGDFWPSAQLAIPDQVTKNSLLHQTLDFSLPGRGKDHHVTLIQCCTLIVASGDGWHLFLNQPVNLRLICWSRWGFWGYQNFLFNSRRDAFHRQSCEKPLLPGWGQ